VDCRHVPIRRIEPAGGAVPINLYLRVRRLGSDSVPRLIRQIGDRRASRRGESELLFTHASVARGDGPFDGHS
jgi:hypothetical protein